MHFFFVVQPAPLLHVERAHAVHLLGGAPALFAASQDLLQPFFVGELLLILLAVLELRKLRLVCFPLQVFEVGNFELGHLQPVLVRSVLHRRVAQHQQRVNLLSRQSEFEVG